ncbi:GTPase HflX [Shewanella sp. D64]|uniref:GTPase HflX n=1 Tax=unclassified Shewanella TaxID=196818 RepID=UPI0022BA3640|nr:MULTISPECIES: GTPase HflX [unclassified Shewanella]MEC4726996.1 GTPase HflX [Shewanella sp. D64]MEC4738507.1 GTPase HflX [Shewanella sp. E94]WBJ93727.1 GTPase HflX [Shewanella sp. MTB7]
MSTIIEQADTRALLISIRTPNAKTNDINSSLAELGRLVGTLGFTVFATQTQKQNSIKRLSVLGAGKLEELARMTGELDDAEQTDSLANIDEQELNEFLTVSKTQLHANVVVFDCELSPMQLRNVEQILGVEVFDRTGIIIEIFSRHASTRTARLQVELARLNYLTPRLRSEHSGDRERQSGRGEGESLLAIERHKIRDKQAELRRELKKAQEVMQEQRSSRVETPCVALVGYTNAGKSSLMRGLTGSDVLVEDKLFATLDTTVRALSPLTQPRILISDTVGFINKLPHDLIASFHSTLEEAKDATLLLYVVDASDKDFRTQLNVVDGALQQLNLDANNRLLLLNKVDCLTQAEQQVLSSEFSNALQISTRDPNDITLVHQAIQDFISEQMCTVCFNIPYTASGIMGEIHSKMQVIEEEYHEHGMRLTLKASAVALERLNKMLQK